MHVDSSVLFEQLTWHTKLAPAVLAAVKTEFSYVIIPHRNIGVHCDMDYMMSLAKCPVFPTRARGQESNGSGLHKT